MQGTHLLSLFYVLASMFRFEASIGSAERSVAFSNAFQYAIYLKQLYNSAFLITIAFLTKDHFPFY